MEEMTRFRDLIKAVVEGSEEAAKELVDSYGRHIMVVVRRSLNKEIRVKFDSMDFAQVIWASVFADPQRLLSMDSPQAFIRFLAVVARNKVIEEFRRRFQTKKYGIQREVRIDDSETPWKSQLISREASPSAFAVRKDTWEKLIKQLPEEYREVLQLKLEGATLEEIAAKLQVNERTIRRILKKIEKSKHS